MKSGKLIKEVTTRFEYNFIVVRPDNLFALARFIGAPRESYELRLAEYEGVVELIAFSPRCGSENMILEIGDTLYIDDDDNLRKFDLDDVKGFKVFPNEEEDPSGYEKKWLATQRELERLDREYRILRFGYDPDFDLPDEGENVIIQSRDTGFWYDAFRPRGRNCWLTRSGTRFDNNEVVRWWPHHLHEED